MMKSKSKIANKRARYLLFAIEILVFYILQTTPDFFPEILKVKPAFLIIIPVTISFVEDEIPCLIFAAISGLLIDVSGAGSFGFFAIYMTVVCCIIRVFVCEKFKLGIRKSLLITSGVVAFSVGIDWYVRYCQKGYSNIYLVLLNNFLPIIFYSIICIPAIYFINYWIANGTKDIDFSVN